jgi:hypothetical protein
MPLTLTEKYRLRLFDNRFLTEISRSKGVVVMGIWRKLRNEELRKLTLSSNKILNLLQRPNEGVSYAEHVALIGMINPYGYKP